ncbi:MAG: ribonuclease P protein component, partial [Sphingobium sp.]
DHVLIGRADGVERDFALLRGELEKALRKAARAGAKNAAGRGAPSPAQGAHGA